MPADDMPLMVGTTLALTRGSKGGNQAARIGDMSITACGPAESPPLPNAVEDLALGEMSIRGDVVTVGAGEVGWENHLTLPS